MLECIKSDLDASLLCMCNFLTDELIWFIKYCSTLRMTQDDPVTSAVLDHGWGDLSTEVAIRNLLKRGRI